MMFECATSMNLYPMLCQVLYSTRLWRVRLPKAKIDYLEKEFIAKNALKCGDLNPKSYIKIKNVNLYLMKMQNTKKGIFFYITRKNGKN